jgi:two-component system LytT family sensor kinase
MVPQLIVQPLVENAVRHGLSPRAAPGTLSIAARRRDGTLELTIADDGIGLAMGWDGKDGLGLANVRGRLARMYGAAAHLSIESPPEGGLRAVVTLPFRKNA